MSQQYLCPVEYTTLNLTLKKTKVRVRVRFRFWLSVYSVGQKYRWLSFLVIPVVISALCPVHVKR